jgi:hypothetical protein
MHFTTTTKAIARTPAEWLNVGAGIGKLVNKWSIRDDLVVMLGENTASGAPAMFNPMNAEIEVNIESAFGKFVAPHLVGDFETRMTQLDFPVASGAIFHEACHARFSRFDLSSAHAELVSRNRAKDFSVLHFLEEGRIEAWGVRYHPENRVFLRACAMEIVIADILEKNDEFKPTPRGVASLCALTMARVSAGVLDEEDIEPLSLIIKTYFETETIEKLRSVWERFQAHEDHSNFMPLLDLAKEWNDILDGLAGDEPGDDEGEGEGSTPGGENDGEPEGEGGTPMPGKGGMSPEDLGEAIKDALKEMAENIKISNQNDIADAQVDEEWREERESRAEHADKRKNREKVAEKMFSGTGSQPGENRKSNSTIAQTRKPTSDERIAAVKVGSALEKAKYRERGVTEHNAVIPPGRLRSRAMVQGAALKEKGVRTPVEAWRQTKRKQTETPELRVGVMVDISGSMGRAMEPMASTAWVMSEAVRRVQGKCAMVYYGESVFATLKPGQHLSDVVVYTAPDGTEEFDKAFLALDGALNFTDAQNGARLLVIVSDGHYRHEQEKKARQHIADANKAGTAVLWITFRNDGKPSGYLRGTDGKEVYFDPNSSPADVATVIGQSAASALASVGKRNG